MMSARPGPFLVADAPRDAITSAITMSVSTVTTAHRNARHQPTDRGDGDGPGGWGGIGGTEPGALGSEPGSVCIVIPPRRRHRKYRTHRGTQGGARTRSADGVPHDVGDLRRV